MKNQSIASHQSLNSNDVAALLQDQPTPLVTHIEISEASKKAGQDNLFIHKLQALNAASTKNHEGAQSLQKELSFGAPQIDLALPTGTLARAGLHELNPKHWRDQQTAIALALGLLNRQNSNHAGDKSPVFCFLTEDQTELKGWLQSPAINSLNISSQDLVLVTAKHTDDLLWAIEETILANNNALIAAHFTLLAPTAAQRLNFLAKENGAACVVVCNHKSEGQGLAHSSWSVTTTPKLEATESAPDLQQCAYKETLGAITPRFILTLNTTPDAQINDILSWQITWQPNTKRFRALPAPKAAMKTLH